MTSDVRGLTFRVSRERALDGEGEVWYAGPVNVPVHSGVSAETLKDLRNAVEEIKHFLLGVPEDTRVLVEFVYDLPGVTDEVWQAHRELQARLSEAGLSEEDRATLLLSA